MMAHQIGSLASYSLCAAFAHGLASYEPSALEGQPGTLTIGEQSWPAELDKFGIPKLTIASLQALYEVLRKEGWE